MLLLYSKKQILEFKAEIIYTMSCGEKIRLVFFVIGVKQSVSICYGY